MSMHYSDYRELDKLIEEKVFKNKVEDDGNDICVEIGQGDIKGYHYVYTYSQCLLYALKALKELPIDSWSVYYNHQDADARVSVEIKIINCPLFFVGDGDTEAEAICRAILCWCEADIGDIYLD